MPPTRNRKSPASGVTEKSESLLSEARRLAGENGLRPLSFWWKDPETFIARIVSQAQQDPKFRRRLLADLAPPKPGPGVPGRLPKSEVLLSWFEMHEAAVRSFKEAGKLDGDWAWSKDPHRATLEFFASAFKVEINSVAKSLRRAKLKVRTK